MTAPHTISGKVIIIESNMLCAVKLCCADAYHFHMHVLPVLVMGVLEGRVVHMRRYHAHVVSVAPCAV